MDKRTFSFESLDAYRVHVDWFVKYMSYKRGFPLKKDMHCVTKYVELLYP